MRRTLVLAATAALLLVVWAPVWSAHLIAGSTNGVIRDVDTSVPGESLRYNIGFGVTGLAVDDANGILYASGGGAAWNALSIFDLATGVELIGSGARFVPAGFVDVYGLEFLYDETGTGRLFSIGYQDGKNYLIEYSLGAGGEAVDVKSALPVVDTSGAQPLHMAHAAGLAFNTATGKFESNQSNNLYWEFGFTGEGTVLGGLGLSGVNGLGLGEDGIVYSLSAGSATSVAVFSLGAAGHQIAIATNAQVGNGWAMSGAKTPRMTVIPEPSTLLLLAGCGLLSLLRRRRR